MRYDELNDTKYRTEVEKIFPFWEPMLADEKFLQDFAKVLKYQTIRVYRCVIYCGIKL